MSGKRRLRPDRWTLITALLAAGIVAGCGDDDDDDGGEEPTAVAIEATGGKNQVTYTAPDQVDAGPAEITFTNNSESEEQDGQLIRTDGDRSEEEIVAELQRAVEGQPVQEWFQAVGGPGEAAPGETSTATQVLEPGTYYIAQEDAKDLTRFEVAADGDGELPDTAGTITAQEYSFTGEGLEPGTNPVLLENAGAQWHHFIAAPIKPGKTIEDVKEFIRTEKGEPPIDEENPLLTSTVLDGGESQVVDLDLQPGSYAFLCFISDRQGGPPHVVKGMVSEVTVEE